MSSNRAVAVHYSNQAPGSNGRVRAKCGLFTSNFTSDTTKVSCLACVKNARVRTGVLTRMDDSVVRAFVFGRATRMFESLPSQVCPRCQGEDPHIITVKVQGEPGVMGRALVKLAHVLGHRPRREIMVERCSKCPTIGTLVPAR